LKVINWFSQNVAVSHPRLIPLPIGLENLDHYNHGIPAIFNKLSAQVIKRKPAILYGFSISTNIKERSKALKLLSQLPLAESIPARLNSTAYLRQLQSYMFVASPPGNGIDCHRTWEAMYLGVVPIVLRSKATEFFAKQHLPVWIINDWSELNSVTSQQLKQKYKKLKPLFKSQSLWFSYWKNVIHHD
jgi:hypothetical protein